MTGSEFSIGHEDEQKYEYDHHDGTAVKVSFDDHTNGARVSAYHYDTDGSRLAYYPFRVSSADDRRVTYQRHDRGQEPPAAVVAALHTGGWEIDNISETTFDPAEADPLPIQLLDVRDYMQARSTAASGKTMTQYYDLLASVIADAVITEGILRRSAFTHDLTENEWMWKIKEEMDDPRLDGFGPIEDWTLEDLARYFVRTAIETEDGFMTNSGGQMLTRIEYARNALRTGEADDFDEAMDMADEVAGAPTDAIDPSMADMFDLETESEVSEGVWRPNNG